VVGELGGLLPAGGTPEPQGLEVVVGERLGVILGAAECVDPRRRALVALGPGAAGDLAVRDVAHEQVAECVLLLAAHG
jgi:hypothetical protein